MTSTSVLTNLIPERRYIGIAADKLGSDGGVQPGARRTEAGIGAMMPWADKLWFVNYPDGYPDGEGMGLWSMGNDQVPTLVAEGNYCDAGRIIYSDILFIGHWAITTAGVVTAISGFAATDRIAAYAKSGGGLYALTMGGVIYSVNASTLVATVANSNIESSLSISGQAHGKAFWGHSDGIHYFAALNMEDGNGRLAAWNKNTNTWTNLDANNGSWIEIGGCYEFNQHVFAFGHDDLSGLMWVFDGQTYGPPKKFRLPLASDQMKAGYQQEWMRLRAVETERNLLDHHGMWYQLSPVLTGTDVGTTDFPRMEPIARHMRTIPDFTNWNGRFVLGGNETSPQFGNMWPNTGQPQSGLMFLALDDIWGWGKPVGNGFWYRNASVSSGDVAWPMLMRGFDKKSLHLHNSTSTSIDVRVQVYTNGSTAYPYDVITVAPHSYVHHEIPPAFTADWITIVPLSACTDLTAWIAYS